MHLNKALKLIPVLLTLVLTTLPLAPSQAAPNTARVQYSKSKDGRYIYIRSSAQIEAFNPEQAKALGAAFERIKEQIEDLKKKSPRVGTTGKIDKQAIDGASEFDKNIDGIVSYMQKYYGEIDTLRQYLNVGAPTAVVFFLGVNWAKTPGWSPLKVVAGGSVVMGAVFVPQNVRRIEIDTGKIEEYFDWDSNLVFWPTGDMGLVLLGTGAPAATTGADGGGAPAPSSAAAAGVPGLLGGNQRFGLGLIWGRLDQASDFHGLVTGASVAANLGTRANFKFQALTNFSKKQAISNLFVTAALERGPAPVGLEIRGSLGYIVDAASFMGAAAGKNGSPEEVLANAAARAIDKDAATGGGPAPGGGGGGINPLPINPNIPPLIQ